jgi:uncharacterized membrane protein YdjX (TVP38/TMEM64 family)
MRHEAAHADAGDARGERGASLSATDANADARLGVLTPHDGEASDCSRWSQLLGLTALIACGVAFFAIVQAIGPERMRDAVRAAGPLAPVAYVLMKAVTVVVTPLSGTPLRLASGALFGFWDGVVLSVLGGVLGGSANFWIARTFGRGVVARLLGPGALARVEPLLGRLANWRALALARVVLAPLWDALSYGVGLTRLRYRTYLAVAVVGDLVPTMLLVGVGASVAEVGVIETGTSGAHAIEAAAPMLVLVVGMVLAAGLMLLAAALLRPRLARLLASAPRLSARPSVIPGTKPDPSAAASDDAERAA